MGPPSHDLSLVRLGPSDAHRAVPCLVRAFWDYPETTHLLPDEEVRRRVLPRYLGADALGAARLGGLDAVSRDGIVVGAAAWSPPEAYPVPLRAQLREAAHLLPVAPWGVGALREARRGQAANRERHQGRPPHFWLRALGVDPSHQDEGIGTTLVRALLHRADDQRRGCFLFTAAEANVGWYTSLGFAQASSYRPTPRWPQVWAMWRDPV